MNFPAYNGPVSGALSGISRALVDAVAPYYPHNPVLDGVLRIPALIASGYATGSANFGF